MLEGITEFWLQPLQLWLWPWSVKLFRLEADSSIIVNVRFESCRNCQYKLYINWLNSKCSELIRHKKSLLQFLNHIHWFFFIWFFTTAAAIKSNYLHNHAVVDGSVLKIYILSKTSCAKTKLFSVCSKEMWYKSMKYSKCILKL